MTTFALTISTDELGLGVIPGGRVIAERRRAVAADQYPAVEALYRIIVNTDDDGMAEVNLKADDSSTYHIITVYGTDGVPAYRSQILMPPAAKDLHDLPESPAGFLGVPAEFDTFAGISTTGWTLPRLIVVAADETNDSERTTYFFDGITLNWVPMVEA